MKSRRSSRKSKRSSRKSSKRSSRKSSRKSKKKSKKSKILGMLGEEELDLNDLFDMDKAQQNIYEIENKIKEILND